MLLPGAVFSSLVAASLQGAVPESGFAEASETPQLFLTPNKTESFCRLAFLK